MKKQPMTTQQINQLYHIAAVRYGIDSFKVRSILFRAGVDIDTCDLESAVMAISKWIGENHVTFMQQGSGS